MVNIVLIGMTLGIPIYAFTLIATKHSGKLYYAPIVTFLTAILVTAYGVFKVGGFEGMGYGILAFGILVTAVIGSAILPFLANLMRGKKYNKLDKTILIVAPLVLFTTIGLLLYSNDNYWVIKKGENDYAITTTSQESYYIVSTISEGSKQVHIQLGKEYIGKNVEVKKVKVIGNTEITLKIIDDGVKNKVPYISVGIDEIIEPLVVKTTDGEKILAKK